MGLPNFAPLFVTLLVTSALGVVAIAAWGIVGVTWLFHHLRWM